MKYSLVVKDLVKNFGEKRKIQMGRWLGILLVGCLALAHAECEAKRVSKRNGKSRRAAVHKHHRSGTSVAKVRFVKKTKSQKAKPNGIPLSKNSMSRLKKHLKKNMRK